MEFSQDCIRKPFNSPLFFNMQFISKSNSESWKWRVYIINDTMDHNPKTTLQPCAHEVSCSSACVAPILSHIQPLSMGTQLHLN